MINRAQNQWVVDEPKIKWYSVALFNLIVLGLMTFSNPNALALLLLSFTIGASAIPVLIAHSNSVKKLQIGYGVPFIILLPVPYFVWDAMNCTGKMCGIGSAMLAIALGAFGVIFAVFFTFSYFSRFWDKGFVIFWSIFIPIALFAIAYLCVLPR